MPESTSLQPPQCAVLTLSGGSRECAGDRGTWRAGGLLEAHPEEGRAAGPWFTGLSCGGPGVRRMHSLQRVTAGSYWNRWFVTVGWGAGALQLLFQDAVDKGELWEQVTLSSFAFLSRWQHPHFPDPEAGLQGNQWCPGHWCTQQASAAAPGLRPALATGPSVLLLCSPGTALRGFGLFWPGLAGRWPHHRCHCCLPGLRSAHYLGTRSGSACIIPQKPILRRRN